MTEDKPPAGYAWCNRCQELVKPVNKHIGNWKYFLACPQCLTPLEPQEGGS
jgi:hypothetical protein